MKRVHEFTSSRVHEFTGPRVHEFTSSRVHVLLLLCAVALCLPLAGCGASVEQCTLVANDAGTFVLEVLPTYAQANPADANQAGANATKLLTDARDAITQAQTFSAGQIKQDAAAVIAVIEELLPVIPAIIAVFGEPPPGMAVARLSTRQAILDHWNALRAKLALAHAAGK